MGKTVRMKQMHNVRKGMKGQESLGLGDDIDFICSRTPIHTKRLYQLCVSIEFRWPRRATVVLYLI